MEQNIRQGLGCRVYLLRATRGLKVCLVTGASENEYEISLVIRTELDSTMYFASLFAPLMTLHLCCLSCQGLHDGGHRHRIRLNPALMLLKDFGLPTL